MAEIKLSRAEWEAMVEATAEPQADPGVALVRRSWYAEGLFAVVMKETASDGSVLARDLDGTNEGDREFLEKFGVGNKRGRDGELVLKAGERYFLALFAASGRALARELRRENFLPGTDTECGDYPFCFPDCRNLTRCAADNCRALVCKVVGRRDWPETEIVCDLCFKEPWRRGKAARPVMFDLLE